MQRQIEPDESADGAAYWGGTDTDDRQGPQMTDDAWGGSMRDVMAHMERDRLNREKLEKQDRLERRKNAMQDRTGGERIEDVVNGLERQMQQQREAVAFQKACAELAKRGVMDAVQVNGFVITLDPRTIEATPGGVAALIHVYMTTIAMRHKWDQMEPPPESPE